jgi:hypothetical protein
MEDYIYHAIRQQIRLCTEKSLNLSNPNHVAFLLPYFDLQHSRAYRLEIGFFGEFRRKSDQYSLCSIVGGLFHIRVLKDVKSQR